MADAKELFDELTKSLKIDTDNLDLELIQQPNSFFHAGRQHTLAIARRDKKDHELDVLKAVLDKEIRDRADADDTKITEAQVKSAIVRDKEHRQTVKEFLEAKQEADEWAALKEAYQQRSYILGNLVTLANIGYFGDVSGARDRNQAKERVALERRR